MTRRLVCSALAWIILASAPVHAQSRDVRPTTVEPPPPAVPTQGAQPAAPVPPPSIERMRHPDGRLGYWLDEDAYTDALAALQLEANYLEQLALLNRRLALRATEATELRASLASQRRRGDELHRALRLTEAARARAVERAAAWYRQPITLLGAGVVLGAGFALLMAFAIGESA